MVGFSQTASGAIHGFLWEDGSITDLGTLGGELSQALAINNRGQVAGDDGVHAAIWENGSITDLGGFLSEAFGINNQGQVVGSSQTATGAIHAFLWENGSITDLGELAGLFSRAHGINDRGQVVGTSATSDAFHAALWENGSITDLGTVGGECIRELGRSCISEARAINNRGQVVGYSQTARGDHDCIRVVCPDHATLWTLK